jgi:hypothetical protein
MKRIAIIAVVVLMAASLAGSAFAANSLASGSKGISVGIGNDVFAQPGMDAGPATNTQNPVVDISGRFFVGKDVALTLGAGLQLNSGDSEGTYLSLNFGARKYLSTNDFAPFVGGQISYTMYDVENAVGATIVDATIFDLVGFVGAEYFFNKQFSMEGAIGVGLGQVNDDTTNSDTTYLGTRTLGVKANFYF